MKRYLLTVFTALLGLTALAQTQTFDLATYTIPPGWKKTTETEGVMGYTITNNLKGTYCQLGIYKSMNSMGSVPLDFETEWQDLVAKPYGIAEKPQSVTDSLKDQWQIRSGTGTFDFSGGISRVRLFTLMGYGKRMSVLILSNSNEYDAQVQKVLRSLRLAQPETPAAPVAEQSMDNPGITGTWGKNASVHQSYADPVSYGNAGYSKDQYTFNEDGSYRFNSKIYRSAMSQILLVKESGTYQLSGQTLTLKPQKSVIESWSKKTGTDTFGSLLSTQNRPLEKTTYQFTRYYFSGIQEWNLVLQADQVTQRDGLFSNNTTFSNAWYYRPISSSNPLLELP